MNSTCRRYQEWKTRLDSAEFSFERKGPVHVYIIRPETERIPHYICLDESAHNRIAPLEMFAVVSIANSSRQINRIRILLSSRLRTSLNSCCSPLEYRLYERTMSSHSRGKGEPRKQPRMISSRRTQSLTRVIYGNLHST